MKTVFAALLLAGVGLAQSSSSVSTASDASPTATSSASASAASGTASGTATGSNSASASGTNTASSAASTPNSSIYQPPSGISGNCTLFLNTLDSDPTFTSCTAPLLNATAQFGPSSNPPKAVVESALDSVCGAPGCDDTYIRTQLTLFKAACPNELFGSNPNDEVKDTYDILYIMQPLKKALCAKDGDYCVFKAPSNDSTPISTSSSAGLAVANNYVNSADDQSQINNAINRFGSDGVVPVTSSQVSRRDGAQNSLGQYAPNTQVFGETGVIYLYTLPSLSSSSLCTNCTEQILKAYAAWEGAVPYASGLANSPMLGTQDQLWTSMKTKCGDNFVQYIQTAAGAAAGQIEANAGVSSTSLSFGSGLSAAFAVVIGLLVAL